MKIIVTASFNYGAWSIDFRKEFNFPFVPFYNMILLDNDEDSQQENTIEFVSTDYTSTRIYYDNTENCFNVHVRYQWPRDVSDETIDDTLKTFKQTGWERWDTTNIDDLKELISRNAN